MKIEYTIDGSQIVFKAEVATGLKAYVFLLSTIDGLDECRFLKEDGVVTLNELCVKIGEKFDMDTLELDIPAHEAAIRIGEALAIPSGV